MLQPESIILDFSRSRSIPVKSRIIFRSIQIYSDLQTNLKLLTVASKRSQVIRMGLGRDYCHFGGSDQLRSSVVNAPRGLDRSRSRSNRTFTGRHFLRRATRRLGTRPDSVPRANYPYPGLAIGSGPFHQWLSMVYKLWVQSWRCSPQLSTTDFGERKE